MNISSIRFIKDKLSVISTTMDPKGFILHAMWNTHLIFKPNEFELGYEDQVIVAYTSGPGASFCYNNKPQLDLSYLGHDARYIRTTDLATEIAILDAAFYNIRVAPDYIFTLTGSIRQKALGRAYIVTAEIERLLIAHPEKNIKVLTVGSVGTILQQLSNKGYKVYSTDLDTKIVGSMMSGVLIQDGSQWTLPLVAEVDVALITGMSLTTNTLDDILRTAFEYRTKIVIFAQTGSNFASYYRELGVSTVVSERFPFYMFPGESIISVYR